MSEFEGSSNPRISDQTYQGYRLAVDRFDPTGTARTAKATVFKGSEQVFVVDSIVTYTFAGEAGSDAGELAADLATRWARGIIDTARFEVGGEYKVQRDSYYQADGVHWQDEDLKAELLFALQRMKRSEPTMSETPYLDTRAFAEVLGAEEHRVASLLVEMAAEGLVRQQGAVFGATTAEGRCEITAEGLRHVRQIAEARPPSNAQFRAIGGPGIDAGIDTAASNLRSQAQGEPRGHVFLSYVREDSEQVDALQRQLESAGLDVWRDVKDLWPGELWKQKLRAAIQEGALAFVPCFSKATAAREVSTMFEELTWAAEEYRRRNPDRPWIFPVFFDPVKPPEIDLGADRTLSDLQWTLLYEDWDSQVDRLIQAIKRLLPTQEAPLPAVSALRHDLSQLERKEPAADKPIAVASDLLRILHTARAAGTVADSRGIGGEVFWYNEMAEAAFVIHPGLHNGQVPVLPIVLHQLEAEDAIRIVERADTGRGFTFFISPDRLVTKTSSEKPSMKVATNRPFERQALSVEEIGDRLEGEGPFEFDWVPTSGVTSRSGVIEIRYAPSLPIPAVDVRLWRPDIERIRESGAPLDRPVMVPGDMLRVPIHLDLSIGRQLEFSMIYNFQGETRSAREQKGAVDTT